MFRDFFIVKKSGNTIRNIYLKIKYLNILKKSCNNRQKFKRLCNNYRQHKFIERLEENDKNIILGALKGYKIRENLKRLEKKKDKIYNIIENTVKEQINNNRMVTIELDNKINSEIIECEKEMYYENKLNKGLEDVNIGVKTNVKGCEVCCCGIGSIISVLCYKLKKWLNL